MLTDMRAGLGEDEPPQFDFLYCDTNQVCYKTIIVLGDDPGIAASAAADAAVALHTSLSFYRRKQNKKTNSRPFSVLQTLCWENASLQGHSRSVGT